MNNIQQSIVAVIWRRLGPYHIARLRAATSVLSHNGYKTIGVEIAQTDSTYEWAAFDQRHNVEVHTLFPGMHYDNLSRLYICRKLTQWLSRNSPEYVFICGWSTPEALCALRWCIKHGSTAFLMSESKEDDRPRYLITEMIKSAIVRKFSAAVVGGQPHSDYATKLGLPSARVFTGYDVVDNDYFSRQAADARIQNNKLRSSLNLPDRYLLSVSRFIEEKNLFRLIEAYKMYASSVPAEKRLSLVMCGGGALENRLKTAASGIDSISWPGFRQIGELPAIYALASAFIIPSTIEPWGLVLNEAMACGLPVLVSKTAGCRYELVREGQNGFLFDPFRTEDIAASISRFSMLLPEAVESMSQKSSEIISKWGPDRFGSAILKAVSSIDSSQTYFDKEKER